MKIFYIIFVWELYFFIELIDFSRKKLTLYKIIYSSLKQTDVSFHISCVVAKIYSLVLAYPFGLWHLISLLSSCCHRHKVFDFRLFFLKNFLEIWAFFCAIALLSSSNVNGKVNYNTLALQKHTVVQTNRHCVCVWEREKKFTIMTWNWN